MRVRFLPAVAAFAIIPALPAAAQQADSSPQILQLPGQIIEVVGLHRWTLGMLQDSLKAHGTPITSGACAATLRYKLGFADASVAWGMDRPGEPKYMLLTLVEPQDSSRVKHRDLPIDTTAGRKAWEPVWQLARNPKTAQAFRNGLALYISSFQDSAVAAWPEAVRKDSIPMRALWSFLKAHATPADQQAALAALDSAPTLADRSAAAAILFNFPKDDRTWVAYANAMLESDGPLQSLGIFGLEQLFHNRYRPSSWNVIVPQLHAILDGTSHFMIMQTMMFLLTVKPDSALAPGLLKNGGTLLVELAGVREPFLGGFSQATLQMLSGRDYGKDVAKWRAWVASL